MNKAESFFKALLLKEYEDRLKSVSLLKETKVTDPMGRIVLEPDLKVRHKSSGFEYTIKKVMDTNGNINVILRTPEAPRVQSSATNKHVIGGTLEKSEDFKEVEHGDEFAVSKEDFENSYEVD